MTEHSRRRDVILLTGVAAVAMAVWAVALVGLDVRLAAVVPHLLIGGIGAVLVLRTDARLLGWLMATSSLFVGTFTAGALFEIYRLISRTVGYALVVTFLGGVGVAAFQEHAT